MSPTPTSPPVLEAANWINGQRSTQGARKDSINPATYDVIGHYPDDGLNAAQSAVAAAKAAFQHSAWAHDNGLHATVLEQLAQAFEHHRDRLLEVLALENGKVKGEAAL